MPATNPFKPKSKPDLSLEDSLARVLDKGSADLARKMTQAPKEGGGISGLSGLSADDSAALDRMDPAAVAERIRHAREGVMAWAKMELRKDDDGAQKFADNGWFHYGGDGIVLDRSFGMANFSLHTLPPDLKEINGTFMVANNQLSLFANFPRRIQGSLMASNNKLSSWQNFPLVEENVVLGGNYITSFKGAPAAVKGNLDVMSNRITSIADVPRSIKGNLIIAGNPMDFGMRGEGEEFPDDLECEEIVISSDQLPESESQADTFLKYMKKRGHNIRVIG